MTGPPDPQPIDYRRTAKRRRGWLERLAVDSAQLFATAALVLIGIGGCTVLGIWASDSWLLLFAVEFGFLMLLALVSRWLMKRLS
jgi:hypothetical protein